ncbi:hypothetical protein ACGFIW_01255 [Micromonospora sp. NPDC048935]|uniref:hypothetical protein n=1 Tax=Micromonospora sp. NPDC048935 TaxID=3364262 RepID=UPI003715586E
MSPKPILFEQERYEPRVCASDQCLRMPVVTYLVTTDGVLFGRPRTSGDLLYVCDVHDREASAADYEKGATT